jgi:uncharacterized protein
MGKEGLRAGWGLLIYLTLFFTSSVGVGEVIREIFPPPAKTAKAVAEVPASPGLIIGYCALVAVTILVTWIMSKIERRPNTVYGLGSDRKLARFFAGLVWGVACLSLLALILIRTGFLVIDARQLFGRDILIYGALWLFFFLLVGVLEEYFSRGYMQYTLARGLTGIYKSAFETPHSTALGFWTSALIISILFGLGHSSNHGESPIGLLSAGLASMVFCFSLWRTGSLWWAIGFHAAWDWSQSFLYGVADSGTISQHHLLDTHPVGKPILSGGATGPEGSIFVLAIFALICFIIFTTLHRTSLPGVMQRSADK